MNAPQPVGELDRRKYLGGSDAAAVFGVSPWRTPLDLFLDKVKPPSEPEYRDPARERFFRRRKQQEPFIAAMLREECGMEVVRLSLDEAPNRYIDPEHEFLAAEIDFEFLMTDSVRTAFPERPEFAAIQDGTLLNGEIKTVHPFAAAEWGEQGSEEVPIHYAAQVMHGLGVTRRPAAIVAALFGLDNLLCFPVMSDPETIEAMRKSCVLFWRQHVEARVPPAPVNLDDIKRLYSRFAGRPAHLDDDRTALLQRLDQLRANRKQVGEQIDEAEFQLAEFIARQWGTPIVNEDGKLQLPETKDNALLMAGDRVIGTWSSQRGTYLDQRRLKAEKPDVIDQYTKEHHYRTFRLKKGKST